jgi:hypothetical protein
MPPGKHFPDRDLANRSSGKSIAFDRRSQRTQRNAEQAEPPDEFVFRLPRALCGLLFKIPAFS